MKIAVSQKHIKGGEAGENDSCAIALAVQDNLKSQGIKNAEVSVDGENVSVCFEAPLNKVAQAFVEGFDTTNEPDPSDFDDGEDDKVYKAAKKEFDKKRAKVKPFEFELKN